MQFLPYSCDINWVVFLKLYSVGSFNTQAVKSKEWKNVLKEWLTLLKLMRNPRSFYRSQFLKEVLQYRLVKFWFLAHLITSMLHRPEFECWVCLLHPKVGYATVDLRI